MTDTIERHGIEYRDIRQFKYELARPYVVALGWPVTFERDDYELRGGVLTLAAGFQWNGSDIAPDTDACRRGSAVHDALCRAMNLYLIGPHWQGPADAVYRAMLVEDGMARVRAWWRHRGLRRFDQLNPERIKRRREWKEMGGD